MHKQIKAAAISFLLFATGAVAQTAVTGTGTANTVPLFTGSSTLGNSNITQSNGNIGILTTSPVVPLDINGYLRVYDSTPQVLSAQGAYLGWNILTGSTGETSFINNQGGGPGGFAFINTPSSGSPKTTFMFLNGNGNLGIGTTAPRPGLEVANLDTNYPSTITSSVRVGGVNAGSSSVALYGVSSTYQILFSSYRDLQTDTVGAKIAAINNAVYSAGGAGNYWRVQNTDIAFSTLSTLPTSTDATTEKMRLTAGGNLGIGTAAPGATLEVNGSIKVTSKSGGSMTFQDGTVQATAWNGTLAGGDYAESIDVQGDRTSYEPGDVIVIDPAAPGKFVKSGEAYSNLVAGVFSTKPGLVGRRATTVRLDKEAEVPMAMMGIVPTKVSTENGAIEPGNLLVTASTPGYAMKGTDRDRLVGAVIGKALAPLKSGTGVIEVLISLQ